MTMKNVFYAILIAGAMVQGTQAQEKGSFRVGLDFGYAIPDGGTGASIALEPKINIADNINVGLRFEAAGLAKNIEEDESSFEADLAINTSSVVTFDYYFNYGKSSFAPFVGIGLGYHTLANVEADADDSSLSGVEIDEEDIELEGQVGGLLRAGFELGKLRLALSYNLIGESVDNGREIKNSYYGISLGFYTGGGKWRK